MKRLWWHLVWVWILGACAPPPPTPSTPPTPPPLARVARVAEVSPLDDLLLRCARQINLLLTVTDLAYPPHRPQVEIWITWGTEPWDPQRLAFWVGAWKAMPVVHQRVGVSRLNLDDVRRIYQGEITSWASLGGSDLPLFPLIPSPGHPVFEALRSLVEPQGWASHVLWAPTPNVMLSWVEEFPGGLGWIPQSWLEELPPALKPLELVSGAPFTAWPVLVQTAPAATPAVEAWLRCFGYQAGVSPAAAEEVSP